MRSSLVRNLNRASTKTENQIPILLVKLSIILSHFRNFRERSNFFRNFQLYGEEYFHVAATHSKFPKALAKSSKCTHVLTLDADFNI